MSATAEQVSQTAPAAAGDGKTTTLAALKAPAVPEAQLPEIAAGFTSSRAFALLQRAGQALAASSIIPEVYRGNLPNCVIALEMAQRIGASPLMVMQNLYIVYGRPAWSAKFLIACFNQCGRFSAIRYIWSGVRGKDDWGCQAWAIERETGEKIFGPVITLQLAKDEGWYGRKDSKWKTIPEKMFMYRAAAWMIDTHAPELSMGIRTDDEVHDAFDATRGPDGQFSVTTESLRAAERQIEGATTSATSSPTAPKEEPAPPSDLGGPVPHFDEKTAIAELEKAKTVAALDAARKSVWKDFADTRRQLPIAVEAKYQELKEALGEAEAKRSEY